MTRGCNLKIMQFRLFTIFLLPALLLISSHALHAQMSPPFPPMFMEGQTTGAEGTILRGTDGTYPAPSRTAPRALPPSTAPATAPESSAPAVSPGPANLRPPIIIKGRDTGETRALEEEKTGTGEIASPSTPPQLPSGKQTAAKSGDRMVTLDFNNVDLQTFVKFISELTGKNFVLDEKVQGKVTVISPTKISVDDAYQVFLTVLELKGFTAVGENKGIKMFSSVTMVTPLFFASLEGNNFFTLFSPTAGNPCSPRTVRNTWYASSTEIFVGDITVTFPCTFSSRTKFLPVSSLINFTNV